MRHRDIVGRLGEADNVENPSALPAVSGQDKGRVIGSWVYSLPLDLPRPDDDDDLSGGTQRTTIDVFAREDIFVPPGSRN